MPLDLSTLSLLIVEDTVPMQKLLSSLAQSLGFKKPLTALNGVEGYESFDRYKPDMVITDWMMEGGDGLQLTKKIRSHNDPLLRMTPVILITGYSSISRVQEARDTGVTEFLVKPFTALDISKRISHVINNPRDFIHSREFFGPDRRRKRSTDYTGPKRRLEELDKNWVIS